MKIDRVAVTGATSMLGASLIDECITQGIKVLAFVHRNSTNLYRIQKSPLVKIVECDLDEMETFDVGVERCDVMYHFAWGSTDKDIRDLPMPQLNSIKYCIDAVELAARLGCKKFVGSGSQAEYGINSELLTPETKVDPITSYGVAKFSAGKLCEKLCRIRNMVCIWPRIFSVYGPYMQDKSMLPYALIQFLKKEPANFTAATQNWEFLYQTDAAKMFIALGENVSESGVYLISSGESKVLKDFIYEIREVCDNDLECNFDASKNSGLMTLKSDPSKTFAVTGIKPSISFKEGISKMLDFMKLRIENGTLKI